MSDWFLLPHLAGLRIEGPDARAFAHAQFTSAFDVPNPKVWQLTSWCNPKGRVIAVILARCDENHVDLVMPAIQVATVTQGLRMYSIGRKVSFVEMASVSGAFLADSSTLEQPAAALAPDPQRLLDLERAESIDDGEQVARWRLSDLRSGIAWIRPDTSVQFLPQALGLEERGGLSYRKGCYPGQEIIARVHYLGKAKERLSAFRQPAATQSPDDSLVDSDGQPIGRVLETLDDRDKTMGLAVVPVNLPDTATVYRGGDRVQLLPPESL